MHPLCVAPVLLLLAGGQPDPPPPPAPGGEVDYEARLNDLLGKGITPERNANALLWSALGPAPEGGAGMPDEFFRRLGIPRPPADGAYFIGLGRFMQERLKLDPDAAREVYDQQSRATQRPWAAADYPHIAAWLAANEKPLAVVAEAVKRPDYYNPIVAQRTGKERGTLIGALLPGVQKGREMGAAIAARAMLRVSEGKPAEAWVDLLACHRLGRLLTRGGTLIEGLVGIAIGQVAHTATLAYLARDEITPQRFADHLRDLRALPVRRPMADTVDIGERNVGLDSLKFIRRGGATPKEQMGLEMLDWPQMTRDVNGWYDRMVAALRIADRPARQKALDAIEQELAALTKKAKNKEDLPKDGADLGKVAATRIGNTLMGLLAPAIRKVNTAYERAEQSDRNLEVALALAAYRRDAGRYPAALADLAPKYLATIPGDLFAGGPLVYRPADAGYLLYSVGPNGRDDGGRGAGADPPGDDLIVRMPPPEPKAGK